MLNRLVFLFSDWLWQQSSETLQYIAASHMANVTSCASGNISQCEAFFGPAGERIKFWNVNNALYHTGGKWS